MAARFYVYRILANDGGTVLYIGKGSGRRLQTQERRFSARGEIVERFASERAAYKRERELIASENPTLNRHPGGNGCRSVRRRRLGWEIEMDRIGTREYAKRVLARHGIFVGTEAA